MRDAAFTPEIVYEDNHLLIAVKPPNVLSQGDATGDPAMDGLLRAYLKEKYQKPGAVYLGLVHRMDRPVGGLMAFARTSKAAARLSAQLQAGRMAREYLAVAQGTLPDAGALRHFLLKDGARNLVTSVPEGTVGAKEARLSFRALARDGETTLVWVTLGTGRSHQIRVQFQAFGHPLRNDMRYGTGVAGAQVALWGAYLRLDHPTRGCAMGFGCLPRGAAFERADYAAAARAALDAALGTPLDTQLPRGGDAPFDPEDARL